MSSTVLSWLANTWGIRVSSAWLDACIEWLRNYENDQDYSSQNVNLIREKVFEQWLHGDISDLQHSYIPQPMLSAEKFVFTDKLALQVVQCVNISQPLYGQLRQIDGTVNANALVNAEEEGNNGPDNATQFGAPPLNANKPKNTDGNNFKDQKGSANPPQTKTTCVLDVTDGVNTVRLMDWSSSPNSGVTKELTQNAAQLIPGCKLLIQGPVLCRRGVLLMGMPVHVATGQFMATALSGNVRVLGGTVDELAERYKPRDILVKKLLSNLPQLQNSTAPLPSWAEKTSAEMDLMRQGAPPANPFHGVLPSSSPPPAPSPTPAPIQAQDEDFLMSYSPQDWPDMMDAEPVAQSSPARIVRDPIYRPPPPDAQGPSHPTESDEELMDAWEACEQQMQMIAQAPQPPPLPPAAVSGPSSLQPSTSCPPKIPPIKRSYENLPEEKSPIVKRERQTPSSVSIAPQPTLVTPPVQQRPTTGSALFSSRTVLGASPPATSALPCTISTDNNARVPTSHNVPTSSSSTAGSSNLAHVVSSNLQDPLECQQRLSRNPQQFTTPFCYIQDVYHCVTTISDSSPVRQDFVLRGFIVTLLTPLRHNDGHFWSLRVRISDGTATIDCDVSDYLLARWLSLTAREAMQIKYQGKNSLSEANSRSIDLRQRLRDSVRFMEKHLKSLTGLFTLSINRQEATTILMDFRDVASQDVAALVARIKSYAN